MTHTVLAIDPGPGRSGWVIYDGRRVIRGLPDGDNTDLLDLIFARSVTGQDVAIEWISSYGMPVGDDVFETCWWVGRFGQQATINRTTFVRIPRPDIKLYLCGSRRAKDSNVRQALLDRFGGVRGRKAACGVKAAPGPLYGCRSHMWSALAVAVTYWDLHVAGTVDTRDTGDTVD